MSTIPDQAAPRPAHVSDTGHKDDMFGVCATIGRDLGFNPDILRVALAVSLLFVPMAAVAAYAGMGLFVAAGRLLFPPVRRVRSADVVALPAPRAPVADERMLEAA